MMTAPAPRARWPLFAVGGCALLLACAVVVGAAAVLIYLRQPATAATTPNVEYILDASPRMLTETDGATRLSVAQGVLAEIIRPASTQVAAGLRVFGTGTGQTTAACQDTALLVPKRWDLATTSDGLRAAREALGAIEPASFEPDRLEEPLRALAESRGWKAGDLFMAIRVAVTGRTATPPLFQTLVALGRQRVLARLDAAIGLLAK